MILVTLGTQDKSFKRLLKEIDNQIVKGNIKEEVIIQAGHTKYKSENMQIFDFINKEELNNLMDKANLIITHAGVGTIIEGLNKNKKMIVVPRLKKYSEHTNDHQLQITNQFANSGYIIPLYEIKELDNKLIEVLNFVPKKYKSNNMKFIKLLKEYIDTLK
jgi:UDP-N-acetylglucosamine transferase subunit ALG13